MPSHAQNFSSLYTQANLAGGRAAPAYPVCLPVCTYSAFDSLVNTYPEHSIDPRYAYGRPAGVYASGFPFTAQETWFPQKGASKNFEESRVLSATYSYSSQTSFPSILSYATRVSQSADVPNALKIQAIVPTSDLDARGDAAFDSVAESDSPSSAAIIPLVKNGELTIGVSRSSESSSGNDGIPSGYKFNQETLDRLGELAIRSGRPASETRTETRPIAPPAQADADHAPVLPRAEIPPAQLPPTLQAPQLPPAQVQAPPPVRTETKPSQSQNYFINPLDDPNLVLPGSNAGLAAQSQGNLKPKARSQVDDIFDRLNQAQNIKPPPPPPVAKPNTQMQAEGPCLECAKKETPVLSQTETLEEIRKHFKDAPPLVQSAYKVMDVLYQRCDAHEKLVPLEYMLDGAHRPPGIPDSEYVHVSPTEFFDFKKVSDPKNHFYLKDSYPPGCRDMRKTPPVFHVAGSSSVKINQTNDKTEISVDVFNNNSNNSNGQYVTLSCSQTVRTAMANACMKAHKTTSPNGWFALNSTTIMSAGLEKDNCFKPIEFTASETIKPGDVFTKFTDEGHVMLIDSVGADPWGLSGIKNIDECHDNKHLDPENFDFTILQSYYGNRLSMARLSASDLVIRGGTDSGMDVGTQFIEMAKIACEAKFNGKPTSAVVQGKAGSKDKPGRRVAVIARHQGAVDAACMVDNCQPKLAGEECLKSCQGEAK